MNVIGKSKKMLSRVFSWKKTPFLSMNNSKLSVRFFSFTQKEYGHFHFSRTGGLQDFSKNNQALSCCGKCTEDCGDDYKFFCTNCKYLRNPSILDTVDHFDLFSLEEEYDIDMEKLDHTFYQLQHMFHPDRFTMTDDATLLEKSTTYSSFINNSYQLLKNDFKRAKYLLKRKGYKVIEEGDQITDFEFLQHIMEIREEIEFAESQEELNILKSSALLKKQSIVDVISELFKQEEYDEINESLIQLRYTTRILEAIDKKEREFI